MYFGAHAARLKSLERRRQSIDAQPVLVERHADHAGAAPARALDGATVGELLHDHGVAGLEQDLVDQIEALQRARGNQDVVGRGPDPALARELVRDEGAQARVAERIGPRL